MLPPSFGAFTASSFSTLSGNFNNFLILQHRRGLFKATLINVKRITYLSGTIHSSGDHGQLVLYKQHGGVIVRGSLRSVYVRMKTDFKMHWQERAEQHQALEPPSMRRGLLPMRFEPCGAIVYLVLICPTTCQRYLFRSQLSLISVLKKVDSLYIYIIYDSKSLFFSWVYVDGGIW